MRNPLKLPGGEVMSQVRRAGASPHLLNTNVREQSVYADVRDMASLMAALAQNGNMQQGALHRLHEDIGQKRTEFRGFKNAFGEGSLQIVLGLDTNRFYADVDKFSPYEDVVGIVGHSVEVIAHFFKKWWR